MWQLAISAAALVAFLVWAHEPDTSNFYGAEVRATYRRRAVEQRSSPLSAGMNPSRCRSGHFPWTRP